MKLSFSLEKKEANIEADVEGLVEKNLEYKSKRPVKITRYQIKQEEKRKNKELEQKERMQKLYILLGLAGVMLIVYFITTLFNM